MSYVSDASWPVRTEMGGGAVQDHNVRMMAR